MKRCWRISLTRSQTTRYSISCPLHPLEGNRLHWNHRQIIEHVFQTCFSTWCFGLNWNPARCLQHALMARASQIITEFLAFDVEHFGGMAASWTSILKIAYPHLAQLHLSDILLALVDRAYRNRETFQCGGLLDFIEFYGGVGNLSTELLLRCLNGATFDTMYRPVDHDCLGQGFRLWLDALCSTCEGALVWLGTQCSSFVALCASVSKRRLENQWMGDNGREFVQVGNCHMIITALIYFLATLLQCATCLEQPLNSCLPNCPLMASVLTFCNAIKVNTHLGSFGAETPGPSQIWTTCLELQDLWRPKPGNLPGTLVSKGPNGAFTGLKEPLEASGIYTRAFGAEVADLFLSSYRHQ